MAIILNNCQIVVLKDTDKTPHQELMDDWMAIMHRRKFQALFSSSLRRRDSQLNGQSLIKLWNAEKEKGLQHSYEISSLLFEIDIKRNS